MMPPTEAASGSGNSISRGGKGALALFALTVGLLHLAPYWAGARATPPGWKYTWVLSGSPDYLQYRVFERQSLVDGPIVRNTMTLEANTRHIPVFLYWVLAKVGQRVGTTAEHVYPYAGALFAAAMVVLVGLLAYRFTPEGAARWWTAGVILLGGGLGGHLKWMQLTSFVGDHPMLSGPIRNVLANGVFENIRGNYLLYALTEAHYLLVWLVTTATIYAFYLALKRPTISRVVITAVLTITIVFLHIYEGVLLSLVFGATTLLCRSRSESPRAVVAVGVLSSVIAVLSLGAVVALMRSGGLPGPPLDAITVLLGVVIAAYPLAWLVLALGFRDYWASAGFEERFLVGWASACVLLVLSGPFYPFPNRGSMTMGIPLYLMAGTIYARRWGPVRWPAVMVVLALCAPAPAWLVSRQMEVGSFRGDQPYKHLSPAHQHILDTLGARETATDVLLVNKRLPDWRTDDLWLVAGYRGRYFPGHGFLTVDYEKKREAGNRFYEDPNPDARRQFLLGEGITLVFVASGDDPSSFAAVPGLRPLVASEVGTLFAFDLDGRR